MSEVLRKVVDKRNGNVGVYSFDGDNRVFLGCYDFDETKTPKDMYREFNFKKIDFELTDEISLMIKDMICVLKQFEGEYTYASARIRKTFSQILEKISYGNIYVRSPFLGKKDCRISFAEGWEEFDVPKDYEGENPLAKPIYVMGKSPKNNKAKRNGISGKVRQNVFMRDKYTCQICGRTIADGISLHLDHIIPKSKGGSDSENNLQCLCNQCNLEKSNRTDLLHDKLKLKELEKKSSVYE